MTAWTKTVPVEPGWYWVRLATGGAFIAELGSPHGGGPWWWTCGDDTSGSVDGWEFWSERLSPPKESSRGDG